MQSLLIKMFGTALAQSQVTTAPEAVKTQFDRAQDQEQVAQLLRAGCTHMRKAFDIEDINLEDLIATAMDDPQAIASENKAFRGINFADLLTAYRQFCKNEAVALPAVDLGDVIDFYNKAGRAREQDYWTPKNYDGGSGGILTLRRALENSRNLATVHLLDGGIEVKPEASLNRIL